MLEAVGRWKTCWKWCIFSVGPGEEVGILKKNIDQCFIIIIIITQEKQPYL